MQTPPSVRHSEALSSFLNASRWLAAFLVVAGHVRHLILVDYLDVEHKTMPLQALYLVTGLGHEAVVIFFVISGFLVGGLTLERWQSAGPTLRAYALARISRIYVVLLPALATGLALDLAGRRWFNASELYTNAAKFHTISLDNTISSGMDLRTFAGNVAMMQGTLTGPLGTNGPLWSLAYEWWYYCLFATLLGVCLSDSRRRRFGHVIATIAVAAILPAKILAWGFVWSLGVGAHVWMRTRGGRPHPILGFAALSAALAVSRLTHSVGAQESSLIEFARDFMLGAAYALAIVSATRLPVLPAFGRLHERLAAFSYTTYLCHFPAMVLIVAIGYEVFGFDIQVQPRLPGLIYFAGVTAVLYVYCFGFSLLTEQHTGAVRQWLDGVGTSRASRKVVSPPARETLAAVVDR